MSRVGLNNARLQAAWTHVRDGGDRGTYGAAVLGVAWRGQVVFLDAWGSLAPAGPEQVETDTRFDLASLTKPFVAAALLSLVEDGLLSLEDSVQQVLPEAAGSQAGGLRLWQLAAHTSGLPAWRPLYKLEGPEEILKAVLRAPLMAPPGTRYIYSDLGYILLGHILAQADGTSLEVVMDRRVCSPLGLSSIQYRPPGSTPLPAAPTANCEMRPGRTLHGEVHDANAWQMGGIAGHAGLFGTAEDLLVFGSALLGLVPTRSHFLGAPARHLVQLNRLRPEVGGHSIGCFTHPNQMLPRGDLLSNRAFGHTGFTGTMFVCDPEYQLVVVLLTNRVLYDSDNTGIRTVRRQLLNAIASAVEG